jgi:ATP-dependent Zn protease
MNPPVSPDGMRDQATLIKMIGDAPEGTITKITYDVDSAGEATATVQRNNGLPTLAPLTPEGWREVKALADEKHIATAGTFHPVKKAPTPSAADYAVSFLMNFGPIILIIGLMIYWMRKMPGGMGDRDKIAKSKAKLLEPDKIEFGIEDGLGGQDELRDKLLDIVMFLKNPAGYKKIGGRKIRGVLLKGPPGTGKTWALMCLAKSAGVPFFSINGSSSSRCMSV